MMDLTGKVAIVTGGGRGLGRAMAIGLAQAGASVVITAAQSKDEIDSVASEAGRERVYPVLADVTQHRDCERVVDAAVKIFSRLDLLVNNAGRGMKYISPRFMESPACFWEADPDNWRRIVDVNVTGPFLMARAAVPLMLERGWGRIINISMNHSTMRRRGFSPYGHTKAALESETIIWAKDLTDTGITVNALLPGGATATGMIPDRVPEAISSRLLAPEIMVPPLLWLASNHSDGVTGRRFDAGLWRPDLTDSANAANAAESAGWGGLGA